MASTKTALTALSWPFPAVAAVMTTWEACDAGTPDDVPLWASELRMGLLLNKAVANIAVAKQELDSPPAPARRASISYCTRK